MPLDPEIAAVLDGMVSFPEFRHLSVAQTREMAMWGLRQGPPVHRVEDRTIPGPGGQLPVRCYWPSGETGLPILVYLHGGGWTFGNLETHDCVCRGLTNGAGAIVVAVDYRLAPEHRFPAAVEDADAAAQWAADNAGALGGDPARLAIGGDSAGANLAAAVTLIARDRGNPRFVFQLLIYPTCDYDFERPSMIDNAKGYVISSEDVRWFWGNYLRDEADSTNPLAVPFRATTLAGVPPALVITAEFDPLRDDGEDYGRRLQADGVPAVVTRYPGMVHGFFSMPAGVQGGADALCEASDALRSAFRGLNRPRSIGAGVGVADRSSP